MSSAMFWFYLSSIFFCLTFVPTIALNTTHISEDGTTNVTIGEPLYIYIHKGVKSQTLKVNDIIVVESFLICEVHCVRGNLTLSLSEVPFEDEAVTGRNLGVVTILKPEQNTAEWFLFTNNYTGVALIYVKAHSLYDPLPGGCNQEFNLEIDPNIKVTYPKLLTNVDFQWSNGHFSRSMLPPSCEDMVMQTSLHYYVFVYFMNEVQTDDLSTLQAVTKMLSVDDIFETGRYVKLIHNNNIEKSELNLVSYPCVSAVVNLIVTQSGNGIQTSAAYVPTVINPDLLQCEENKNDALTIVISCFTILLGFLLCFFGHRYFKTELFIFGAIAGFLIAHITVSALWTHSLTVVLSIDIISAFVGGVLWLLVWTSLGIPVISVLMVSLVAGYLVSCILFFTPFGNLKYWENDFNYGMTFASGTMLLPVIFLAYTKLLNIICCALVGSYAIVFSIDILTYGIIRYIFLNSFHHMIYADFNKALVVTPFQKNDIILAGLWVGFFVAGVIFQLYSEKGRAPFPPANNVFCCQNGNEPHRPRVGNEREPLLPDNPPIGRYGTVGRVVPPNQQPYPSYTVIPGFTTSAPAPK
ncbi:transmembrane 7 superfamily member 3 [Octopus bimaculoides]|uniref:TM7S3/TM198-like domain-containing protein n=1 Tax=Octopus bimaculoides TaxID=37653 RepID=A0A0L8HYI4_OCTBM|nr:transmembrane 7 superfamily member 3 [Octopus bimaculoides]|eukprot:XP_014768349.1 PREDICTED: transmembrane 7 superfamily member 3-like [Octopus bimaculoides]